MPCQRDPLRAEANPASGKIASRTLYGSGGLKIFAAVLAVIWEILSAFLGKLIYLAAIFVLCGFYGEERNPLLFLHVFFFLTIIGAYLNTYLFNPTNEKYYAVILMRMDAGLYTLSNYCYSSFARSSASFRRFSCSDRFTAFPFGSVFCAVFRCRRQADRGIRFAAAL